jgi:hypothetical protein
MSSKTQNKKQVWEESVEAKPRSQIVEETSIRNELKSLADSAVKTAWKDMFADSLPSVSEMILGGGDLHEGQEISLSKKHEQKAKAHEDRDNDEKQKATSEHMEYFRTTVENVDRTSETRTEMEMKKSVDEIRMEIKKLIQTSKIVERTVKDATADKAPVKPGKYHISFFEFVLSVIRDASRKLEDAANLGSVFTSKKQQSKYWNSYKQQGTKFGLSGERSTVTQTG